MLEQQDIIDDAAMSHDILLGIIGDHDPSLLSAYYAAESAAIVEGRRSVRGLADRIHRLSQQIRSRR
jgi:hypothetical protein